MFEYITLPQHIEFAARFNQGNRMCFSNVGFERFSQSHSPDISGQSAPVYENVAVDAESCRFEDHPRRFVAGKSVVKAGFKHRNA